MPIIVVCPGCPAKLSAPDDAAGKHIRCPKCGTTAPVPALIAAEEVPVVDAAVVSSRPKPKVVVEIDEDDPAPSSHNEEERPRKKKRKRYLDDDDDYEHDHPRRKRASGGGGGSGGLIAGIVLGGLLLLAGLGTAIYFLKGKGFGSPLAKKTPVPAGWEQYSYPNDGFKAFLPKPPSQVSVPVGAFPANNPWIGGGGFGRGRFQTPEMQEVESFSMYSSGNPGEPVQIQFWIIRFKRSVPSSLTDQMRKASNGQFGGMEMHTVRWLGYDGVEQTHPNGVIRIVTTNRHFIMATVNGSNGRAKPEEENGFFDNVELTR